MRWLRIIPCVALTAMLAGACDGTPVDPPPDEFAAIFKSGKGAVIHKDEIGCGVLDAAGNWFPENYLEPPDFPALPCGTEVATNSKNLNASITVHASGVPNPTGKTVKWGPWNTEGTDWAAGYPELTGPPYPCFLLGTDYDLDNPIFTVKWKQTLTPSGQATLSCQYSKKWEFNCEDWGNCGD